MRDALILDAVRTPRGRGRAGKGALSGIHPQELLAQTLNHLATKSGIAKGDVSDVVIGCVSQAAEQGGCLARNALITAEWPEDVTGVMLNRFCGSGLQAVNFAAMGVMSGMQELAIGGGVESMSRVPMGSDGGMLDGLNKRLTSRVPIVPQGISADLIATMEGITREQIDAFALLSQKNAGRAMAEGRFAKSLFSVVTPGTDQVVLSKDEFPRPETTIEGLQKLEPVFVAMGAAPARESGETFDQLAVEVDPEGIEICRENLLAHAVDNVRVIAGRAPEALAGLEAPDAVFIGGSKGSMEEIIDVVMDRLQPGGRLVVNAITLENVAETYQSLRKRGLVPEVTLLQVSRAEPLAHYLRYEALNPIQIFAVEKPIQRGTVS